MRSFRILKPDDTRALAILHASAFARPWSAAALRAELAQPPCFGLGLLAPDTPGQRDQTDQIISFVLFGRALDEAEMLTLATAPAYQKQGHARALLKAAFAHLAERGVARCLLDVAADNGPAIALYNQLGFKQDGQRKAYYKRQGRANVDAILMSSDMTGL